jgi:hypothetical protein
LAVIRILHISHGNRGGKKGWISAKLAIRRKDILMLAGGPELNSGQK